MNNEKRNNFIKSIEYVMKKIDYQKSIGTLSEKTVHAVIKNYLEEDENKQEVLVKKFHVDILNDKGIIEIQTRSFNNLRKKLGSLLDDYDITICYPILHNKWLIWIDDKNITSKRKSPKVGNKFEIYYELYKIKNYLKHPHLHLKIILFDGEEYRNLNGWDKTKKRGSTRIDCLPIEIVDEIDIDNIYEYQKIIPHLNEEFSNYDFKKASNINIKKSQIATNILCSLGVINKFSKSGNKIIYKKNSGM